jgi:TolB protein
MCRKKVYKLQLLTFIWSLISRKIFVHCCAIMLIANICHLLHIEQTYGALNIEINKGCVEPIPVAITQFKSDINNKNLANEIMSVIENDLESSGLFRILPQDTFLEDISIDSAPQFTNWRKINATVVVVGHVETDGDSGRMAVKFAIWDPYKETKLEAGVLKIHKRSWRRTGHRIADAMYANITGDTGYFDSRILFIAESGSFHNRTRKLAVMDQDGTNLQYLTDGQEMILTPRFDHKSQRVIYMSYKNRTPQVFLLDTPTGMQELIGSFPGMSFAPRFSPDGEYVVMSIARNGTTAVYELHLKTKNIRKIVSDIGAISTSPSYSPDGKYIVFNSDRGGSRQLYTMQRDGSNLHRISFGGGMYATPVWSPRGDYIAFTKVKGGQFYIGLMRPDGKDERLLTSSWYEEAPSWAPNGRVIMFYRKGKDRHGKLFTVDITGDNERQITVPVAAVEPAWSPLLQ